MSRLVSRLLVFIIAVGLVALTALLGFAEASTASHPARAQAAACHPRLTVVAHAQGSPDDLVWDGGKLLVSDINQGTVGVVTNGHVRTLVAHLDAPEGIVPGPDNSLIVAEQGTNSVVQIKLPNGSPTTLAKLPLPSGKEGVDGINADGPGAIFVPDSARGRLYVLHLRTRKLTLVASGMNRPVAAIPWDNSVVVADEYANAIWRISQTRTHMARVPVPDDLAVISNHLIATGLVGEVWEVAPHLRLLSRAFVPISSDPQGMVADGPDAVLLAVQSRNTIYRLSALSGCL
jgi:streptogramin lyase